jgi:hypothetical protein
MTINAAPWVKETCSTIGTGALVLTGRVDSYIAFNNTLVNTDEVYYAILDANGNREAGLGTFDGSTTLYRTTVHATITASVFDDTTPTPLPLSGDSVVICTFTAEAFKDILTDTGALLLRSVPEDFGVGTGVQDNDAITTDVLLLVDTFWARVESTAPNLPIVEDGYIDNVYRDTSNQKVTFTSDSGGKFTNIKDAGTWTGWIETFTTANSVNPLDFGVGTGVGISYPHTSLDNLTDVKTGFFGGYLGSGATIANGFPIDATNVNYTLDVVLERADTATQTITYIRENSAFANKTFRRTIYQGTPIDWVLIFNSGNSVNPMSATTKADFFALAEKRIRDNAGSGFAEWGTHFNGNSEWDNVNEGIWALAAATTLSPVNALWLGRASSDGATGISRTAHPKADVNGVPHDIMSVGVSSERNFLIFPEAPNGLKTYDTADGSVITHANATTAFASETATRKVITSRQDFIFLESWHEAIEDKDVVYPLGNVQYGGTTWEGITLSNSVVAQTYSSFGEWDTATVGYGSVWSTLTVTQQTLYIQDPKNNIYFDAETNEHIQVRYRIRVVEGMGDEWLLTNTYEDDGINYLRYDAYSRVAFQGGRLTPAGGSDLTTASSHTTFATFNQPTYGSPDIGLASARPDGNQILAETHNGLCFAIPIALVQRRNQGAYHPVFNKHGCDRFATAGGDGNREWYHANVTTLVTSQLQCFTHWTDAAIVGKDGRWGYIAGSGGRVPDDKFYDVIYATDVQDSRMSSKKLPVAEIREKYKRMAAKSGVRGFEGVPFSRPFNTLGTGTDPNAARNVINHVDGNFKAYTDTALDDIQVGDFVSIHDVTKGKIVRGVVTSITNSQFWLDTTHPYFEYTLGTWAANEAANGDEIYYIVERASTHKQADPTWTAIIGTPSRILATFPEGVEGQWIPVIPDGTLKSYKANRKSLGKLLALYTTNDGAVWGGSTFDVDGITNAASNSLASSDVRLFHYESQAHFTIDDENSEVLDMGGVTLTNNYQSFLGGPLVSTLIGKISVGGSGGRRVISALIRDPYYGATAGILENTSHGNNHFAPVVMLNGSSPAIKTLDYLSSENNVAKLMYAYKEIVYDVSFGDNNQFEIIDNQSTRIDDNGNTVIYGTASFNTQYFIVRN